LSLTTLGRRRLLHYIRSVFLIKPGAAKVE
jgi:hypothetical protein